MRAYSYAKALRLEMKPWNIHVSNVNPGFMK
jgi:short-subunit dehydrogenase